MNPQPQSHERSTTADSANVSFKAAPGPTPSQPPAAPQRASSKKAARIARVRERLTGPPSPIDGTVPTKELILENRLRARVLAGSDAGAARYTDETAKTIGRTWEEFGGSSPAEPRDIPPEEFRPLPRLADSKALITRVTERLSGPPSRADGTVPTEELEMENRLRALALAGSDEGAARRTGETAKTIASTWKEFGGGLLVYPANTPPEERRPLPELPDNAETSTDD